MNATLILLLLSAAPDSLPYRYQDPGTLFEAINQYRQSKGLHALQYRPDQQPQVDQWAAHIAYRFEHERGVSWENIAQAESPDEALGLWRSSAGHNENLLSASIDACAISIYRHRYRRHGFVYVVFRGYSTKKPPR